jgi:cobalamin biosynthesis protein CobW
MTTTTTITTPSTPSPSTCRLRRSLLLDALTQLVVQHGILRVKGFAAIPNKPMRLLIQGVGTRFDKHFDRAWGATKRAPRVWC